MKTLQEILASLPSDEDRGVVAAAIEAEKQKGITETRKKGDEFKTLLTKHNVLKDALKSVDIDPDDADITDISEALKAKTKPDGKPVQEWKKDIVKLQAQVNSITSQLTAEKEKSTNLIRSTATSKASALLKNKVYAHEEIAKTLLAEGKIAVSDDGQTIIFKGDAGDIELEKGISEYIKFRSDIAIPEIKGGSGSSGGQGTGGIKTMSKDAWVQLEPKARAEYMAAGGTLT